MREPIATLEKAKRDSLRVQNSCDIIACYCAATEQELRQLLDELGMSNPMLSWLLRLVNYDGAFLCLFPIPRRAIPLPHEAKQPYRINVQ